MSRAAIWGKLETLDNYRETGPGRAIASCPGPTHKRGDRNPSLSIGTKDDGKVVHHCFAGCDSDDVRKELGAEWRDYWPDGSPPGEKRYEVKDRKGATYDTQRRFYNGKGEKVMPWVKGKPTTEAPLFGAENLPKLPTGSRVLLVEGLSPAETLAKRNVQVVATVTGAATIPSDESLLDLRKFTVILWPDNDTAGKKHMAAIGRRLTALGIEHQQLNWPDAPLKGDAADYFALGGTVEELEAMIRRSPEGVHTHTKNDEHVSPDERLSEWEGGELLSEVTPEDIKWLWDGYVPLGKLTVADGDPGLGKTMLYAADLAARVTTGRAMPDGAPGITGGAGVVIFTAEDAPEDTLQPRFVAAGGDLTKVVVVTTIRRTDPDGPTGEMIERLPTFADDRFIEQMIARVQAKLVIFDPFMTYLPSGVNSFRDQDVRSALAPLARLAQKSGAAFVLIRHLNKANFANALYRGGGSIGIIGAARSGLLVVLDPDDENRRIFGPTKSNLSKRMPSWKYSIIENDTGVPMIQWEEQSERSASELLSAPSEREGTSKLETACDLLREMLADGSEPEKDIEAKAKEQGVSRATLRRAKALLGVDSAKIGVGREGYWVWMLPSAPKGAQTEIKGAHTHEDEHLSRNVGVKPAQEADSSKGAHANGYEHLSEQLEHLNAAVSQEPLPPVRQTWRNPPSHEGVATYD
ncbi:MAG TPA: AAA family ATPase [Ktedonobacterales bacterium]|jgi:RecA-family ATPase